jgi:sugar phosphate isomerase/epimerase
VTVCVEFARYTAVRTIGDAQRLLRSTGQANASIVVDALHLARSGGTPADVVSADGAMLSYLQICDARAGAPAVDRLRWEAQNDRLLPGEGVLPLAELLRTLPPDTPVSVETPCLAQKDLPAAERVRLGVETTRALLQSIKA